MTEFTKGDWIITEVPKSSGLCSTSTGHYQIETNDIYSFVTVQNEFRCESKANANLIAAAPDMYRKMESHLAAWENLYPSNATDIDENNLAEFQAIHKLLASTKLLLAKARGE